MAVLIRPRMWGHQKPPAGSQIDWGHPLARGLVVYFPLNEGGGRPVDLVNNRQVAEYALTWHANGSYNAATTSGGYASSQVGGLINQIGANNQVSVVASCIWNGATLGFGAAAAYCDQDTNNSQNILTVMGNNDNTFGGYFGGSYRTLASPTSGIPFVQVNSYDGGTSQRLRRMTNGQITASASASASITLTNSNMRFRVHTARDATILNFPGQVLWAGAYSRVITDDEAAWLSAEPYAFLIPPAPKLFYFSVSSPSQDATVNATALAATVTFPAPGVGAGVGATAMSVAATLNTPAVGAGVGATALSASAALNAPGVTAGVGATEMSVSASFPTATVGAGIGAGSLAGTASFGTAGVNASVGANALTASAAINSAAVSAGVSPSVLTATASFPTVTSFSQAVAEFIRRVVRKMTGRNASSGRPSGPRGRHETWWGEG